ncbi:unnamed protein product [Effrenium voratum]|nr:unnamed protein product [Effrenium voratum]
MDALHGDGREKLVCAKKQMQDEDALQLQSLLGPSLSYREVDFSVNELTARGMGAVVDICKRSRRLQVLKLYRNRISDDCVEHFADLLRACPGLREVHLSHNLLSHEGVLQLAACVERRAEPLWLRVEQNTFTEPGDLLRQLEKDYSVCPRLDSCAQFRCSEGKAVHVPFLGQRNEVRSKTLKLRSRSHDSRSQ